MSEQARISSNDIRRGNLSENDLDNLVSISKDVLEIPLYIDDTPALNIGTLASRARRLKKKKWLRYDSCGLSTIIKAKQNFKK